MWKFIFVIALSIFSIPKAEASELFHSLKLDVSLGSTRDCSGDSKIPFGRYEQQVAPTDSVVRLPCRNDYSLFPASSYLEGSATTWLRLSGPNQANVRMVGLGIRFRTDRDSTNEVRIRRGGIFWVYLYTFYSLY
jgi:hypothetical protein